MLLGLLCELCIQKKGKTVSIKYVMLGFLSEMPLTGYDLKKKFSDSEVFHWSGNNNQIYKTLVELHEEQLVTIEVQQQESKPPRKIYTITERGLVALRQWLLAPAELPQFRNALLVKLTWADQLEPRELDKLLATYEMDLQDHLVMLREQARRSNANTATPRRSFGRKIAEHWIGFYEQDLAWVQALRQELGVA